MPSLAAFLVLGNSIADLTPQRQTTADTCRKKEEYRSLSPERVLRAAGRPILAVDAFNLLDDEKIRDYLRRGCTVRGMGRGRLKEELEG